VSTGRIRVDAARAIAKLRDYQLVDRRAWVVEATRAAVASGATRIRLDGDANDVWLAWSGPAWPEESIPALFDELVSPEPARDSQHLRLLATAVNSALGLSPAYVDVIAIEGDAAARVRYTPDVLAPVHPDATDDDTPLRRLEVARIERPARALEIEASGLATGMLIHLRRGVGLDSLANLVRGAPKELGIAAAACDDLAVPITIDGARYGRDRPGCDLIRLPLGDGLDGFVALVDPALWSVSTDDAVIQIAEHGAVLATYPLALPAIAAAPVVPIPIRIFIDAPRMPTNASRSAVRRDDHPIPAAIRAGTNAVPRLVDALIAELTAAATPPARAAELRSAALALLAARIGGRHWAREAAALAGVLAPVAALPLVQDAMGVAQPVAHDWIADLVHAGAPYPAELAPWLARIPRLPKDDAARRLLDGASTDAAGVRRRARLAHKALRRANAFRRHARRAATVEPRGAPRIRLAIGPEMPGSLGHPDLFAGVTGEVCLFPADAGRGRRGACELVLLHDEREIETIELESPIPFQAVLASAALRPLESYRGVIRDEAYGRAVTVARVAAIRALEALADPRTADALDAAAREELRRAYAIAPEVLVPLTAASPLEHAPIWPTADGRWTSLAALRAVAGGAVGVTQVGTARTPRDRPVVRVGPQDRAALVRSLPGTRIIDYDGGFEWYEDLDPAVGLARQLVREMNVAALAIRGAGVAGAIAIAAFNARRTYFHCGRRLVTRPEDGPPPHFTFHALVESDALVPDADWNGFAGAAPAIDIDAWQLALARSIGRALLGDPEPDLHRPGAAPPSLRDPTGLAWCTAVTSHRAPAVLLGDDLLARLCAFAAVTVLGEPGPRTIGSLAGWPGDTIPFLTEAPDAGVDPFPVVIAPVQVARLFAELAGKREAVDAAAELAPRRAATARRRALDALRRQPTVDVAAAAGAHAIPFTCRHGTGALALGAFERLWIDVHVEGRRLGSVLAVPELPLALAIDLGEAAIDDAFTEPRPEIRAELETAAIAAASALVAHIAGVDPTKLTSRPAYAQLLHLVIRRGTGPEVRAALRKAPMFRTVRGDHASIEDALDRTDPSSRARRAVRIADAGAVAAADWLGPAAGEALDPLDAPVLAVHDGDGGPAVRAAIQLLADGAVDVSDAIARLQARRRIARGLADAPRLPDAAAVVTRRLDQLGDAAARFAPGEVALLDADASTVIAHTHGRRGAATEVAVRPAIAIAVEAPHVEGARAAAQTIARALARALLADGGLAALPAWARSRLRAAALAGDLEPGDLGTTALFPTTTGRDAAWHELLTQLGTHGAVWYTAAGSAVVPLDPARIALRLTPDEVRRASPMLGLVDATSDLFLDQLARDNQRRPLVTSFDLPAAIHAGALAAGVTIEDAGGRRGIVVPLTPRAAGLRGLHTRRAGLPFDPVSDQCTWPTYAIVDDPALGPDRTWSQPAADAALDRLRERIEAASAQALEACDPPPAGVLVSRFVPAKPVESGHDPTIATGWCWLDGDGGSPAWLRGPGRIELRLHDGDDRHKPRGRRPLLGRLVVHAPRGTFDRDDLDYFLDTEHADLLARIAADAGASDAGITQIAIGVIRGWARPADVREVAFRCFAPSPLDAVTLRALFDADGRIAVISPGAEPPHGAVAIVDDGTILSRELIAELGRRADRTRGRAITTPSAPAGPVTVSAGFAPSRPVAPAPAPRPAPAPAPRPSHPLDGLAAALMTRLRAAGSAHTAIATVGFHPGRGPIVELVGDRLRLAEASDHLRAIDAARRAGSAFADDAIDALAAHVLTVLNVELTAVTDAAELAAIARLLAPSPSL
jgi:hypothetical protein